MDEPVGDDLRPPGDRAGRGLPRSHLHERGADGGALAQWLLGTGRATVPYVARQGTALGRSGEVHVSRDEDGAIWVGGSTVTCVSGDVDL